MLLEDLLVPGTPGHEEYVQWLTFVITAGPTPRGHYLPERGLWAEGARIGFPPEVCALWWDAVRAMRSPSSPLPFRDEQGTPFRLPIPSFIDAVVPVVNADHATELFNPRSVERRPVPQGIIAENLRREAVASCVLDGVPVEKDGALEMLETGREPRTPAERAVWNVHSVLRDYTRFWRGSITPERVLELHRILLEGTAADAGAAGRLLTEGEVPADRGAAPPDVPPPPAPELAERLRMLCEYMDQEKARERRTLVVEALTVQFWVAYERFFSEGNGRLARALYYLLLNSRYSRPPAVALVPLSPRFARAPELYATLFRDARTDANDIGYFVHTSLRVLTREVRRLLRSIHGVRRMAQALEDRGAREMNERQLEVLWVMRVNPETTLAIEAHRRRHGTVYQTARTDLLALEELGFLRRSGSGRAFVFGPSDQLLAIPMAPGHDDLLAHERPSFSAINLLLGGGGRAGDGE
jgi:Fic family protein